MPAKLPRRARPMTGRPPFTGLRVQLRQSTATAMTAPPLPSASPPERRLVPAARLDELLGRAAMVGVSVGHYAAQFLDGWCDRRRSLASCAFQIGFGGLAGGVEQPTRRPGAVAVTGNWDHAGRVAVTAPGVGLELLAADPAGADNGIVSVPAVAGVVDPPCRLLDRPAPLNPAARLGRVAVVADAGAGNVQEFEGGGVISGGIRRTGLRPGGADPRRHSCACQATRERHVCAHYRGCTRGGVRPRPFTGGPAAERGEAGLPDDSPASRCDCRTGDPLNRCYRVSRLSRDRPVKSSSRGQRSNSWARRGSARIRRVAAWPEPASRRTRTPPRATNDTLDTTAPAPGHRRDRTCSTARQPFLRQGIGSPRLAAYRVDLHLGRLEAY